MRVKVTVNITPSELEDLEEDGWMQYNGVILYES